MLTWIEGVEGCKRSPSLYAVRIRRRRGAAVCCTPPRGRRQDAPTGASG